MKIKLNSVVLFLWALLIIIRINISLEIPIIDHGTTVYYIISYALTTILFINCFASRSFKPPKEIIIGLILFIFYALLFGKILVNQSLMEEISYNFYSSLTFYIVIFLMAMYIRKQTKYLVNYISVSYYVLSFSILVIFIANIDNVQSIGALISNVFLGYERTRSSLGFIHPNYAGNIALCSILMSSFYLKNKKNKINLCVLVLDLFFIYCLFLTSSRTSITGLILFIMTYIIFSNYVKIKSKKLKIVIVFSAVLFAICLLLFSSADVFNKLFLMSNRSGNFLVNIPILVSNHRVWIGLGYIGAGEFANLSYNTFLVDNYFLYVLMSTGIIGLLFVVPFTLVLAKRIFQKKDVSQMDLIIRSIFIVNIFSSMLETCFMYPSMVSCFILSVLYLYYLPIENG